jgi:hypothetical protein
MKFTSLDDIMAKAKPLATSAIEKAKPVASTMIDYAKNNPGEVMLGILTIATLDMSESLEEIEQMDGFLFIDKDS